MENEQIRRCEKFRNDLKRSLFDVFIVTFVCKLYLHLAFDFCYRKLRDSAR